MNQINTIDKESYKKERQLSVNESLELLAEYFDGVLIQLEDEYCLET